MQINRIKNWWATTFVFEDIYEKLRINELPTELECWKNQYEINNNNNNNNIIIIIITITLKAATYTLLSEPSQLLATMYTLITLFLNVWLPACNNPIEFE
jgi:hypothetical protein